MTSALKISNLLNESYQEHRLTPGTFGCYDREIAKQAGEYAAIVLSRLQSLCNYFKRDEIYQTLTQLCNHLGWSLQRVRTAIKNLVEEGFLSVTTKVPTGGWRPINHYIPIRKNLVDLPDVNITLQSNLRLISNNNVTVKTVDKSSPSPQVGNNTQTFPTCKSPLPPSFPYPDIPPDKLEPTIHKELVEMLNKKELSHTIIAKGMSTLTKEIKAHIDCRNKAKGLSVRAALKGALGLIRDDKWTTPFILASQKKKEGPKPSYPVYNAKPMFTTAHKEAPREYLEERKGVVEGQEAIDRVRQMKELLK